MIPESGDLEQGCVKRLQDSIVGLLQLAGTLLCVIFIEQTEGCWGHGIKARPSLLALWPFVQLLRP